MKDIIEEIIESIDKEKFNEMGRDVNSFCIYMSEKINKMKQEVLKSLSYLTDREYQDAVCNSEFRPFFCLNNENYFIEELYYNYISDPFFKTSRDFKRKFFFLKDYYNELNFIKEYLEKNPPRIGILILDEDKKEFKFSINCPRFKDDVCVYRQQFSNVTYKDLLKKEKNIEDI